MRWVLEPVSDFSEILSTSISCGDEEMDDFFVNDSERHLRDRGTVTYMMHPCYDRFIVALASLQNDAVRLNRGHRFLSGYLYRSLLTVKSRLVVLALDPVCKKQKLGQILSK